MSLYRSSSDENATILLWNYNDELIPEKLLEKENFDKSKDDQISRSVDASFLLWLM